MQNQIEQGSVVFRQDHKEPPIRKAYLNPAADVTDHGDVEPEAGLQVMPSVLYRHTQPSVRLLRRIMGGKAFNNPKDHEVLARLIRYVTDPGDVILDSYAGSGSTGHAVLRLNADDAGGRRFILVEMEPEIAREVTAERLRRVIRGYEWRSGKGAHREEGLGGGFRYCVLGDPLFGADRRISPPVTYLDLARHVFTIETGQPLPHDAPRDAPLLGVTGDTAVYLLYSGMWEDCTPAGGSVLTPAVLGRLPAHGGPKVVYGTGCQVEVTRLREEGIVFRQIPATIACLGDQLEAE
jgi:hypothetical protein